jgi:hypothetical protein
VLFVLVMVLLLAWPSSIYLWYRFREVPLPPSQWALISAGFAAAGLFSLATFWLAMRSGVRALEEMDRTPS